MIIFICKLLHLSVAIGIEPVFNGEKLVDKAKRKGKRENSPIKVYGPISSHF